MAEAGKTEEKQLTLTKWQKNLIAFAVIPMGFLMFKALNNTARSEARRKREKLRHFKPSYRETFWGVREDLTEREIPLTDEELETAIKANKLV